MLRGLFLYGFGLAPLWAALLVVGLGSLEPRRGADYWAVAPWLPILLWPYTAWSYGIAVVTDRVYQRRGFKAASLALAAMLLISALAAWLYLTWSRVQTEKQEREEGRVLTLVREQLLTADGSTRAAKGWLVNHGRFLGVETYEVGIEAKPNPPRYAIVSVDRQRTPALRLECVTDKHSGLRDPHRPACTQ